MESFKREAGLTDLSSDAQLAISEQSAYEKLCVENGTQLNLIQYLSEYIRKPENVTATLPANVGLNDETLSGLIAQYNALILERNRLLRTSSETNPVVRRLDSNIEDMRAGIITTIASVRKGLLITKADLDRQTGKYAGRISNAPPRNAALSASSANRKSKQDFISCCYRNARKTTSRWPPPPITPKSLTMR